MPADPPRTDDRDQGGDPPCWSHLVEDGSPPGAPGVTAPDAAALARLVDELADAVVIADPDGTITYWNRAAERTFGWGADEAVGQSLDLIIPDRQQARHWDGYRRVMATGETRYGTELLRVPSRHADGERHSIAFTVSLLTDPTSGAVTGIAAVIRDETERWRDEQDLRRRLREAEGPAAPGP